MIEKAQQLALELFEYRDGNLYRKVATGRNVKVGDLVGNMPNKKGYRKVRFCEKTHSVHRIIFLMHHGYIPEQVDHIDGDKLNNKIENLRPATAQQNSFNKKSCNPSSGYKNVAWNEECKKWQVQLQINGKKKYFGLYKDIELADLVAQEARNKYHGKYARHN